MGYPLRGMRGYLSGHTSMRVAGAVYATQFRATSDGTTSEFAYTWDADPNLGIRRVGADTMVLGIAANTPITVAQFSVTSGETLLVGAGMQTSSAISPTAITGSNDNYSPTSWNGARSWIRQDLSASATLTGLTATATGHLCVLVNITTTAARTLTLAHESASSTAANRFLCPNQADYVIAPQEAAWLLYDGTSARWRVLGSVGPAVAGA